MYILTTLDDSYFKLLYIGSGIGTYLNKSDTYVIYLMRYTYLNKSDNIIFSWAVDGLKGFLIMNPTIPTIYINLLLA